MIFKVNFSANINCGEQTCYVSFCKSKLSGGIVALNDFIYNLLCKHKILNMSLTYLTSFSAYASSETTIRCFIFRNDIWEDYCVLEKLMPYTNNSDYDKFIIKYGSISSRNPWTEAIAAEIDR